MNLPQRIVYVDDEQDMRLIVRDIFDAADFEVSFAACGSGQELLNRFRILQPELILLDLKMADMSGPDTIEKLQEMEEAKGVPLIFVTAFDKIEMYDTYKKLGVIGVIRKPFDSDNLLPALEGLWAEYKDSASE